MSEPPFSRPTATPAGVSDQLDRSKRTPKGTFRKGVSGNPTGRPRCESVALRAKLAEAAPDVVKAILEAAKRGDIMAAKIVLDRLCPPMKATAQAITLDLPENPSPLAIAHAIIQTTAAGELPPDIAGQLITSLGAVCRIEEVEELRDRITALERATQTTTTTPKKK